MKKLNCYLSIIVSITLFTSCNSGDDESGTPGTNNEPAFITPISQLWEDTVGTKTYFFGDADSVGRFTGVENDDNGNQNSLSGRTYRFDISFTVIKDQFSNYVDYAGKFTDTSATNKRMIVYSKIDTLYLRPQ